MKNLKHNISRIVFLALSVALALAVQSCSSDLLDDGEGDLLGTSLVLRVFATDIVDESRAMTPGIEKLHSLRIVLVDGEGKVEHNYCTTFSFPEEQHLYHFALKPGKKRIYLIANEESVEDLTTGIPLSEILSGVGEGTSGFEHTINAVVFHPNYQKAIPMSAVYDLEVERGRNERSFYLVKAATKFTFNFENIRAEDVKVKKIAISKTADNSYLMPHVGESDLYQKAQDGTRMWWIDWLHDVCEITTANPSNLSNAQINSRLGWIKNYSVPQEAKMSDYVIDFGEVPLTVPAAVVNGDNITAGVKRDVGPFYSTESFFNPSAEGEQAYTVSFEIEGVDHVLTVPLTELKTLFRNTHVITDVLISHTGDVLKIDCVVDVQPFSSVELRPDFGLERDEENEIVDRDKDGYLTDGEGNYVDAYGNPATKSVDAYGNVDFRDSEGYSLNKDGYPIDSEGEPGYRDETDKRVRNHAGYIMDKNGNLIDAQGNYAYHDKNITDRYVVRDRSGYIIDYEGNLIDKDGNPCERRNDGKVYRIEDGKLVDKDGNVEEQIG